MKLQSHKSLVRVGLGAGLLGAGILALRYALRPASKAPLPDTISPAIFATRVFQTTRGQLVYHESGSGEPLVFLHEVCLGASSYLWSKVYPEFASTNRVYAVDLLGFGESERSPGRRTADDHAQAIAEFLRGICASRRATIVASGLGAAFAALAASHHPELVGRLILLMPTGLQEAGSNRLPAGMRFASALPMVNLFLYRNYLSRRAAVRAWLCEFGFHNASRVTEEMVDVLTTCAQQSGAHHAAFDFLTGRLNMELDSRIAALAMPVTLIWGENTIFPGLELGEKLSLRTGTRMVTLPDAGMLAALERPEALTALLQQELRSDLRVLQTG